MTQFQNQLNSDKQQLTKIISELENKGVTTVHVHGADLNGLLRTKIIPIRHLENGMSLNSALYAIAHGDGYPSGDIVYESPYVWFHTGFGNIFSLPVFSTLKQLPWRPSAAETVVNVYERNVDRYPLDVRQPLEKVEQRLRESKLSMKVGLEFEFGLFYYDSELINACEYSKLKPFGESKLHGLTYRDPLYLDFMEELRSRLTALGINVYSMEPEAGIAMYEIALEPESPLKAADNAALFRHHLKQLSREHGLIVTFMARYQPVGQDSANGTHVHISLYDENNNNLFKHDEDEVSEIGSWFAGGLLAHMKASHLVFRPTINSYRRLNKATGCPEEVCWGNENRVAAIRVIQSPSSQNIRFEHRCSGADTNPYLILALIIAAGMDGVKNKSIPPEMVNGNPDDVKELEKLPRTLDASIELFKASDFVKQVLGKELAEQYWLSRENELAAFKAWIEQEVTDFEFKRYFDGV